MTDAADQNAMFLAGGGEMGARIRAHNWASTPLGSVEDWPQTLRTLVQVLLGAAHPMLLIWGPNHTVMYNDATLPMWSRIHPTALGASYLITYWRSCVAISGRSSTGRSTARLPT